MKKIICVCLAFLMMFFNDSSMVYAKEQNNVEMEYYEKVSAGIEVYELVDDSGVFWGYYEPYSETNPEPNMMSRKATLIMWTINPNWYTYLTEQVTLSKGSTLQVHVSQSYAGLSYLKFYNHSTNSPIRFTKTGSMNGWHGTIVIGDIPTGQYSFGIENASSQRISYEGTVTW